MSFWWHFMIQTTPWPARSLSQLSLFLTAWLFQASPPWNGWLLVDVLCPLMLMRFYCDGWNASASLGKGHLIQTSSSFIHLLWKAMRTEHAKWRRMLVKVYLVEQEQKEAVTGITLGFFFVPSFGWTCQDMPSDLWIHRRLPVLFSKDDLSSVPRDLLSRSAKTTPCFVRPGAHTKRYDWMNQEIGTELVS